MMKKEIICTICPRGCAIQVEGNEKALLSASGYSCNRGLEYARTEFVNPVRILTTTVKIAEQTNDLLPVRSSTPIPKEKIAECMEVIKQKSVSLPIKQYQVIISDICGTGADIVATKSVT